MTKTAIIEMFHKWKDDWNLFAREVLRVNLDKQQQDILSAIQTEPRVSIASGTSRGKDFVSAVAGICFLYLTPKWNSKGELIENTKVAMTAPSDRQVGNIMFPEISRIFNRVKFLPGRLTGYDIRTENQEWFLTGFKADEYKPETWSGFHAVHTMFIITEASGISQSIFEAIEGNLQGDSRLLLAFNPRISIGYAADSQRSPRFKKFRLDSLTAPNVIEKKLLIPGQVDYEWIKDKVENWCMQILKEEVNEGEGDFEFEGKYYRPNDLFRVKIRGMFPKVSEDVLIPLEWIHIANNNWNNYHKNGHKPKLKIGVDVAGMGRDSSAFCYRKENYVEDIYLIQSKGEANHMEIAGKVSHLLKTNDGDAFIDTIGEGAGVYSRLKELNFENVFSCKASEAAHDRYGNSLKDSTGQYEFLNMRAYLFWAIRDWLNPVNKNNPCLPPDDMLAQELTDTKWKFMSNGKIQIEAKEEIKKRIGRSPDKADSLAMTFYPESQFIILI